MSPQRPNHPRGRRVRHVAIVCFSVSGIAFVACGLGLLVSHALTGSLVIAGTAAVGLIYLAMGLLNLGFEPDDGDAGLEGSASRSSDSRRSPVPPSAIGTGEPSSSRDPALSSPE